MIDMDIEIDVNNSIPLWGILCAAIAGAYYLIKMDFRIDKRITVMENKMKTDNDSISKDLQDQNRTLTDIKRIVYKFLVEDKEL